MYKETDFQTIGIEEIFEYWQAQLNEWGQLGNVPVIFEILTICKSFQQKKRILKIDVKLTKLEEAFLTGKMMKYCSEF